MMKNQTVKTQEELNGLNRGQLIEILKDEFKVEDPLSRVGKADLVERVVCEIANQTKKVNKSQLLRSEITKRCRENADLNSGELMKFMEEEYSVVMTRQFIINVKNRHLQANPELLKA